MISYTAARKATDRARLVVSGLEILDLPDDVLYLIIAHCETHVLGILSRVCRRFDRLIKSDSVWLPRCRKYTIVKSVLDNE